MVQPKHLFDPVTSNDLWQGNALAGRECAMFALLLRLLTDNNCQDKLSCPALLEAVTTSRSAQRDRFLSAFLQCVRLLSRAERKGIRRFFLDQLVPDFTSSQSYNSYLHRRWLEESTELSDSEPAKDPAFRAWCAAQGCRKLLLADLFLLLVERHSCIMEEKFKTVWQSLRPLSAAQLRTIMWRIIQCGARVEEIDPGSFPRRYLITTHRFSIAI